MEEWLKINAMKRKEQNEQSESGALSKTLQNKHKVWKYNDNYLIMIFMWTHSEDYQRPLCAICCKTL
jgi:hypothetical protein